MTYEADRKQVTTPQIAPGAGWRLLGDDERPDSRMGDQYADAFGNWVDTWRLGGATVAEICKYNDGFTAIPMHYRRRIKASTPQPDATTAALIDSQAKRIVTLQSDIDAARQELHDRARLIEQLREAQAVNQAQPDAPMTAADILETAQTIVNGDRQADYGHPRDNHACTAALWQAYLQRRATANGVDYSMTIDARDVCMMNILQKISRDANRRKDDNIVDVVGYALNAKMVEEAEK